jgi:hypothetical protein
MTLLVLTYSRANAIEAGNSVEMLDAHFEYIAANCQAVLPGEPLSSDRLSVCICLQGGFYDQYAHIVPLLRGHRLKAVLAIAPGTIRDRVTASRVERLATGSADASTYSGADAFCTWSELEEIARSWDIVFAAYGYTARPLNDPDADLETEIHVPRTLISTRLGVRVNSFMFPFGRCTRPAIEEARTAYEYTFGNGSAANGDWHQRVLHTISADNLKHPSEPFEAGRLLYYRSRRLWKRLKSF